MLTLSRSIAAALCATACLAATPEILTPKPSPRPRINGPGVYGARPGHPFLYRIPCTGERPIRFTAARLPDTLTLDANTGIISGRTPASAGTFEVELTATNRLGTATRSFKIVVGDTLALTPPMGWNDWYTHYERVSDAVIRQAADAMIASGMADVGYAYVNIDDCWMMKPGAADQDIGGEPRDGAGAIRPNRRFPDLKALTEYIHAKGLKAGIYSSPGPLTCAKFTGSYQHEQADAARFAEWGFDFLKYDWCSYTKVATGTTLADRRRPYELMGSILKRLDRDVVFNLCQYGMSDVWKWGAEVGGNCWRTTGDVGLEKHADLPGFYSVGFKNAEAYEFAGPGRWNDPDYILIGTVGDAERIDAPPRRTALTPDEQYSYMSMWSLMAAPLFFSGDMKNLDAFTVNILCNPEVIEIDQDSLGKQARIVRRTPEEFVLAKPLEDGSLAVGLFNLTQTLRSVSVNWTELELQGEQRVHDIWRQKGVGRASTLYSSKVKAHGVTLIRLTRM